MVLPDVLPIVPFTHPARGEVRLPGSKSLTNRALLLAALGGRDVVLEGALFSEDTRLMVTALRTLGCTVEADEADASLRVRATAEPAWPERAELFVGLAGTAARFLTAFCAAAPRGCYRIDGVPQMRVRPMRGLIEALRGLGADIRCLGEEGFFPLEINAHGLRGGEVVIDASASSQLLSALLMVAPLAAEPVHVRLAGAVRWTYVEMTRRLMAEFGVTLPPPGSGRFVIAPAPYRNPERYVIEPDASAASYFHALPVVVGGQIVLPGLRPPGAGLQGDAAFPEVLEAVKRRKAGELFASDFHEISDTFLTLAAIAPLLSGPTRITGIAHTRKQETDRVAGMARELRKLGQDVVEEEDALTITPRPLRLDQEIETYHDHRFAMSFGVLGCRDVRGDGRSWLAIRNPACCGKTFPHFFELLAQLREKSSAS